MEDFLAFVGGAAILMLLLVVGVCLGQINMISKFEIKSHCVSAGQFVYDERCKRLLALEKD